MARKGIWGEVLRFGLVGILATAIHYGVYWVLLHWLPVSIAYSIGYLVSFLLNYVLSARFTFKEKASARNGIGFGGAHLVNYLLQLSLLNLFLWLGLSKELAPLAVYAIAVPTNFILVRLVFRRFGRT